MSQKSSVERLAAAIAEHDVVSAQSIVHATPTCVNAEFFEIPDGAGCGVTVPLIAAARTGELELVQLLLAVPGVRVNARDSHRETALTVACQFAHYHVVRALLEAKASPNVTTTAGQTPLMKACNSHALHTLEIVELLLKAGADPNAQRKDGKTALHLAVAVGSIDVCECLLHHKANPYVESADAHAPTPLWLAAWSGSFGLVSALIARGVDPYRSRSTVIAAASPAAVVAGGAAGTTAISAAAGANGGNTCVGEFVGPFSATAVTQLLASPLASVAAAIKAADAQISGAKGDAKANTKADVSGSSTGNGSGRDTASESDAADANSGVKLAALHAVLRQQLQRAIAEGQKAFAQLNIATARAHASSAAATVGATSAAAGGAAGPAASATAGTDAAGAAAGATAGARAAEAPALWSLATVATTVAAATTAAAAPTGVTESVRRAKTMAPTGSVPHAFQR